MAIVLESKAFLRPINFEGINAKLGVVKHALDGRSSVTRTENRKTGAGDMSRLEGKGTHTRFLGSAIRVVSWI